MAKVSPKLNTQRQYKDAMKRLRGKVSFDYDLRRSLTPGQKSAISRAVNELPKSPNIRFVKPPRKPGESSNSYARRLNSIKKSVGQADSPFSGIYLATKSDAKLSFKGNRVNVRLPGKEYRERHVDINRELFASDALRPAYLMGMVQQAEWEGFNKITLRFGFNRGNAEYDTDDPELFAEEIERLVNKYQAEKNEELKNEIIGGFIFINRS